MKLIGFLFALLIAMPAGAQTGWYLFDEVTIGGGTVQFTDRNTGALLSSCTIPVRTWTEEADLLDDTVECRHGLNWVKVVWQHPYFVYVQAVVDKDTRIDAQRIRLEFETDSNVLSSHGACYSGHTTALIAAGGNASFDPPFRYRGQWTYSNIANSDRIWHGANYQAIGTDEAGLVQDLFATPFYARDITLSNGGNHVYHQQSFPNIIDGPAPAHPWCRVETQAWLRIGSGSVPQGSNGSYFTAQYGMTGEWGPAPSMD